MLIVLPAVVVAFAAICVWLGVRILNRRERWAMRTGAIVVSLPLLYVLSFGPACWWLSDLTALPHVTLPAYRRVSSVYVPIGWAARHGPKFLRAVINWYATAGLSDEVIECEMELIGEYKIIWFVK